LILFLCGEEFGDS